MSYSYGAGSRRRLDTCDPKLMRVFYKAIEFRNITIIKGYRPPEEQFEIFKIGRKETPEGWIVVDEHAVRTNCDGYKVLSQHNYYPSRAIDAALWYNELPHVRWDRREDFVRLDELVQTIAKQLGVNLRWGGEWGDLDHWELVL